MSEYELSGRYDVRPLVLKTVLTYLELDGLLRQGTPFYAGYRFRPLGTASFDEVVRPLRRRRAPTSCAGSSPRGKKGRIWTTLTPDEAAAALGEERGRIVAALGYLEQQGLAELKAADVAPALHGPRAARVERRAASSACSSASSAASGPRQRGSSASSSSSRTTAAR